MEYLNVKISDTATIGESPAAVSYDDKTIYINPPLFSKFSTFQKCFILLHELGHYNLNTTNELQADTFAFNHLVGKCKYSLRKCVATIEETLTDGNQTKEERLHNIYLQALKWDYEHGNSAVKTDLVKEMEYFNGKILNTMNSRNSDRYADARRFMAKYDGEDAFRGGIAGEYIPSIMDNTCTIAPATEPKPIRRECHRADKTYKDAAYAVCLIVFIELLILLKVCNN